MKSKFIVQTFYYLLFITTFDAENQNTYGIVPVILKKYILFTSYCMISE